MDVKISGLEYQTAVALKENHKAGHKSTIVTEGVFRFSSSSQRQGPAGVRIKTLASPDLEVKPVRYPSTLCSVRAARIRRADGERAVTRAAPGFLPSARGQMRVRVVPRGRRTARQADVERRQRCCRCAIRRRCAARPARSFSTALKPDTRLPCRWSQRKCESRDTFRAFRPEMLAGRLRRPIGHRAG